MLRAGRSATTSHGRAHGRGRARRGHRASLPRARRHVRRRHGRLRAAPSWPGRVAAAHTITREVSGELTARLDPERARTIAAPVLLVTGEHSPDPSKAEVDAVVSALPNARAVVLDGQEHLADVLDPGFFAATLVPFLQDAK